MTALDIQYKKNTATTKQLIEHLEICKNNFIPPLDKTVDISSYAKKINELSINFEAWAGNVLAGLVAVYFNDYVNRTAFITNVSTVKQYSGNGIASRLLQNCIHHAEHNSFKYINLQVSKDNAGAVALYSKSGFVKIMEEAGEVEMQKTVTK